MSYNIVPYNGEEEFVFLSYCHQDQKYVYPLIEKMQAKGYRIWYDQGINPGSEWLDVIADKLNKCAAVLACISKNAIGSHNCKKELNFSAQQNKSILLLFIEDFEPPLGLKMLLANYQAIKGYEYESQDQYIDRVYQAEILHDCVGDPPSKPEKFRVSFLSEDQKAEIQSDCYLYGELVALPDPPTSFDHNEFRKKFLRWQFIQGTNLDNLNRCMGNATFFALYERESGINPPSPAKDPDTTIIAEGYLKPLNNNILPISIGRDITMFGRSSIPTSSINYALIGRKHATIQVRGGSCYIQDCNSKNGTYINGEQIDPGSENRLYHNDIISFAGEEYRLEMIRNKKPREQLLFTVQFLLDDGKTIVLDRQFKQNEKIIFPTLSNKQPDEQNYYEFEKWEQILGENYSEEKGCLCDVIFKAVFRKRAIEYRIMFLDDHDQIICENMLVYGQQIQFPEEPIKNPDASNLYTFQEWLLVSGNVSHVEHICRGDATYKAKYTITRREYCVRFFDEDGIKIIEEQRHCFNDKVELPRIAKKECLETENSNIDNWQFTHGAELLSGNICVGDADYVACSREAGTVMADGSLVRVSTKDVIPVAQTIYLFSTHEISLKSGVENSGESKNYVKVFTRLSKFYIEKCFINDSVLVNGIEIEHAQSTQIFSGDMITLYGEQYRAVSRHKRENNQKKDTNAAYLLFNDEKFNLEDQTQRVGRNAIPQLSDKTVSRYHATISCREGTYYIVDQSKNGTSINGELLDKLVEHKLESGDKIRFADVECEFKKKNE